MTMKADSQPRTVEQTAVELNLSKATIRAWIAQRRLGHVRLGRAIRIPLTRSNEYSEPAMYRRVENIPEVSRRGRAICRIRMPD